jgi:hypothetical protein
MRVPAPATKSTTGHNGGECHHLRVHGNSTIKYNSISSPICKHHPGDQIDKKITRQCLQRDKREKYSSCLVPSRDNSKKKPRHPGHKNLYLSTTFISSTFVTIARDTLNHGNQPWSWKSPLGLRRNELQQGTRPGGGQELTLELVS